LVGGEIVGFLGAASAEIAFDAIATREGPRPRVKSRIERSLHFGNCRVQLLGQWSGSTFLHRLIYPKFVMPAEAGIHASVKAFDSSRAHQP